MAKINQYHNFMNEYRGIYLVHIRKTGGTSLNHMFFSLSGEEPRSIYSSLVKTPDHRIVSNSKIYVGWNVRYINEGNYLYAFSHTPFHKLKIPEKIFTITCFRDPVKRVISHYNMLMNFYVNKIDHPCMKTEGKWIGKSFDDFVQNMPKNNLCNQLFMFSSEYNLNQAWENVDKISHYFFTENFAEGIDEINKKTGLSLETIHIRKASYNAPISETSIANLREILDEEYTFLEHLKR